MVEFSTGGETPGRKAASVPEPAVVYSSQWRGDSFVLFATNTLKLDFPESFAQHSTVSGGFWYSARPAAVTVPPPRASNAIPNRPVPSFAGGAAAEAATARGSTSRPATHAVARRRISAT